MKHFDAADLGRLQAYLNRHIPLTREMAVEVTGFTPETGLTLRAPLAPNRNHEGTAFGGSLHGLGTLAAWGLLWLLLEGAADLRLVVQRSRMEYRRAVTGDIMACCRLPPADRYAVFEAGLARRGKAAIELSAQVMQDDIPAAEFSGRFVALRKSTASDR